MKTTGRVEEVVSKSGHKGFGGGGPSFTGHRGEVQCLDCGHFWFSTHPRSGAMSSCDLREGAALPTTTRAAGFGLKPPSA